jgi:hypothetical protein
VFDFFYAFIFVAALGLPVVFFAVVWRKSRKAGVISLAVYLVSYVFLSVNGGYAVANAGGNDWRGEWLPKFLMVEYTAPSGRTNTEMTFGGAVYWPCLLIDRIVWHRSSVAGV